MKKYNRLKIFAVLCAFPVILRLETNDIHNDTRGVSLKEATDKNILSREVSYEGTAGPSSSLTFKNNS